MMATLSGMPGLLITVVAVKIISSVCVPSSNGILSAINSSLQVDLIFPKSETNTSIPCLCASIAAPTPLSPLPNMMILSFNDFYLIFKVTNVMTANSMLIIQKRKTILAS